MRILYFVVSSSVLIGAVLIVRRLFRKQLSPVLLYALWLLPLARILLPFGLGQTTGFGELQPVMTAPYELLEQAVESLTDGDWSLWSRESGPEEMTGFFQGRQEQGQKEAALLSGAEDPKPDMEGTISDPLSEDFGGALEPAPAAEQRSAARLFCLIWLCGSLFLGSYALISNRKLRRSVRRMERAEKRCPIPVYYSDAVASPCLFGLLRPCILMNRTVLQDEELYRQTLRHEWTHYRQKDHIWTFLRVVMCVLYWWHPFVWAAAVCSREDAELACDSRAIEGLDPQERRKYGLALLRLLEQADRRQGFLCGAASMSGKGRSMKRRIEGIMEDVRTKRKIALPVCLVLTAVFLYGCAVPGGSYVQSGWRTSDSEVTPALLDVESRLQEPFCSRLFYTEVYKNGQLTERSVSTFGELESLHQTTGIALDFPRTEDGRYQYDRVNLIVEDGASYEVPVMLGETYEGAQIITALETKEQAVKPGDDLILLAAYAQKEEEDWALRQFSCEELMDMSEEELSSALAENDLTILVRQVLSDLPEDELIAVYQEREYPSLEAEEAGPEEKSDTSTGEVLQRWIDAFIERDGDALAEMMTEETQRWMQDTALLEVEDGDNYFGWSSPWPIFGDELYRILSCTEDQAEILYYAGDSTPHLYVWREPLTFEQEDGEYKVAAASLEMLDSIDTAEDFFRAYPDGVIEGTAMDYASNGLGEALNNHAKETDTSYYERYFDPAEAARDLLNLADGPTGARVYAEETEGRTIVHITFLKDGSTADVEMTQPYGADGIWIPR